MREGLHPDFEYGDGVVRVEGVEPTKPYGQRILSPPRLPFRHTRIVTGMPERGQFVTGFVTH